MTPKERIKAFRNWRDKSSRFPSRFRIVKLNSSVGTFGLEENIGIEWKLVDKLPPWRSEESIDETSY